MRQAAHAVRAATLIGVFSLGALVTPVTDAHAAPTCVQLAGSVRQSPGVKSAGSGLLPATGSDVAYCKVELLYGETPQQNINIVVGLPLSAADGGRGGVTGAWNGRTNGLGGGGCTGYLLNSSTSAFMPVLNAMPNLKAGYVVSGNDLGHAGGDCEPGVNTDGTYNMQFIEDFIRNGIKHQLRWMKDITRLYYGEDAEYRYWSGCSTGGRQGYLLAQELPGEVDGILANDPAIYWTRFATAQIWGQIAMRELTGGPIAPEKLEQTRLSAIAACDASDGMVDGIIDDPRMCSFSAETNVCGTATAPAKNCLTSAEAAAIDEIWDGPRNERQKKIWFGLDRGSDFNVLNGLTPFIFNSVQAHWNTHDPTFDWTSVSLDRYAELAERGSRNIADVTDTARPLDGFKAAGGKLLTVSSSNDQFIYPRGVIHYYRQMASRESTTGEPDFERQQSFYRLFRAPGVGHCGRVGPGPSALEPFAALVNWVEHGIAPQSLLASGGSAAPPGGRTRLLCPYPQKPIYDGTGSTDDARNFRCGGNLDTRDTVCRDALTKYQHEKNGDLDFEGTGASAAACSVRD